MTQESAPHFFDESDGQKLRIHTISTYLKQTFGKKMVKLSLDGGFTCPNENSSQGDRRLCILFCQRLRRHGQRLRRHSGRS